MFKPTQSYSSPTIYSKTYNKFRGVDFTSDPSKVEAQRSPDAVNMIPDVGGIPEKRVGWRALKQVQGITGPSGDNNYFQTPVASMHSWKCVNEYRQGNFLYIDNLHFHFAVTQSNVGFKIYTWCDELGIDKADVTAVGGFGHGTFFDITTSLTAFGGLNDYYDGIKPERSVPCFMNNGVMSMLQYAKIDESDPTRLAVSWINIDENIAKINQEVLKP